ncbi:snRNA-activating protein complex subunit 1 [Strigops habroptila]|nr:snRNA-activating protein complex subunit 1 [Strigops habroptila]
MRGTRRTGALGRWLCGGGGMSSVPGLQADCEELLGAFQEADTVRFERFAELWRERRFHTIFYGRIRALERNKLTKKTLELAQQYFLPPYAFQIRVGALYLLYGLYSTQLCQPKQKIRIALKDWPEIHRFQQDLINSQHYDAAYIFRMLRLARAFHFTAMPKLLNYRTKKKIQENEFKEEFKEPSNRVNSLITNDVLEELMNIHDHYQKMKCVISADKSQPDKALSLIKDDFVATLKDITLEHQEWQQNRTKLFLNAEETDEMPNKKEEGNLLESEGSERANALARIKYKSYSAVAEASKSRRHRQVKLESSEPGSNYGKSPSRSKKTSRRPQLARKRDSSEIKGDMQVAKETVTQHIGMPIITEENSDEEEVSLPKRKRRC